MAPVIGPNFNAHGARRYSRPSAVEIPEDLVNIKDLEVWVGEDQERARAVLAAEEAKGDDARSTLVTSMQALVNPEPPAPAEEGENPPETDEEGTEGQSTPESDDEPENSPAPVIPEGMTKVTDLTNWVGDDPVKAQVVLDAEQAKPEAERRSTLVTKMETIVNSDGSDLI